jgi:hypothetical protein
MLLNFLTKPEAGMPVALFALPPKLSHVLVVIVPVGQRGRNAGEEQKGCRRNEQSGAHGRTSFYKEPLLRINAASTFLFRHEKIVSLTRDSLVGGYQMNEGRPWVEISSHY